MAIFQSVERLKENKKKIRLLKYWKNMKGIESLAKVWLSNPHIFATQCRRAEIF